MGVGSMKPKQLRCANCYKLFDPELISSKLFCQNCVKILTREINPNYSIEDSLSMRRFIL